MPKRIINDAIGASSDNINFFGITVDQITFLMLLCGAFLLSVLGHGIMKMRINTMKGVLAERLLRRLRYTLIARILRFPTPYFERTSQGELVSMVTSESEPMGGLMGDAVAQPVLQAGQMLTILVFLFMQSIAFGLAACALIPLQAWLIPKLQKQINLLNKKRVIQIRSLASEIGEGAAGASTLRTNGGWRYRLALISERLGRLYAIRFEIFQKKFFMKFLNNFIGQLTPFFFYSIGGYLTITGEVTVGALVAALAAYKDLSSPWKELLAYYNQSQDMALRWEVITERFAPHGMVKSELFSSDPGDIPSLAGDVTFDAISVQDADGNPVLEDISARFAKGSTAAITASSDEDRRAFAEVLMREIIPTSGKVSLAGLPLSELHQVTIAKRVGHATSRPVMFLGSFGDNVVLPLRLRPAGEMARSPLAIESARAGNSTDASDADWFDLEEMQIDGQAGLRAWWLSLIKGMGIDRTLFLRGLDQRFIADAHPELAAALVNLRPEVAARLHSSELAKHVHVFDKEQFNPALPVAENLIFATPKQAITPALLQEQTGFIELLAKLGLEPDLLQLAADTVDVLRQAFGVDGTDHPLFRKLGLDPTTFEAAVDLRAKQRDGATLALADKASLLAVTFAISAEKLGAAFPDKIINRVLEIRKNHSADLQHSLSDLMSPITPDAPVAGMTVLENTLFGKVAETAGPEGDALRAVAVDALYAARLEGLVLDLIFDLPLTLGGTNLSAMLTETLAISRATIKRPQILILDDVLSSFDAATRAGLHDRLRGLLPETTIICLQPSFDDISGFDAQFVLQQGRISTLASATPVEEDDTVGADLARKLRALEQTDLFAGLERKQLRLLAFSARWYHAKPGEYVFHKDDDPSSGAYLITEGQADLLLPVDGKDDLLIATSGAGKLVGELGLIRNEPRALDMRAASELTCLRIGAEEFLDVVGSDARTAYKLLQVVAGYVS
ncbi:MULTISPECIES: ABC transporter transmembrane domain-containing protein [unclassified Sulfitobacter]|uniref:ABC transporter transmembrane domain-containing protein n=1 Tax=unclassified Sulfitobacter TaxID=196795 RepID=UPI0023E29620|nr:MULTISPECIES: ABC transporter transmembrane domain-containing protein [unclassified Sulfitobacter]